MASLLYLRLDSANDVVWIPTSALQDADAVRQAIQTKLLLFEGEWWENLNLGLPMFQSILGSAGSVSNQNKIKLLITQQIVGTPNSPGVPFVSAVTDIVLTFDPISRRVVYQATVLTAFGPVTVTNAPASFASIGGNN